MKEGDGANSKMHLRKREEENGEEGKGEGKMMHEITEEMQKMAEGRDGE